MTKNNSCLNCEKPLDQNDSFCRYCGQKNSPAKVSLVRFISEFSGDYFAWDSKIFKSIIPLLVKPGYLTTEYVQGKRVKFIPPFRVFIVFTLIFFLLFPVFNKQNSNLLHINNKNDSNIDSNSARDSLPGVELDMDMGLNTDSIQNVVSRSGLDAYVNSAMPEESAFNKFTAKQFIKVLIGDHTRFGEVLLNFFSKLIFFMLPLFALLLKIIYVRKKKYFYEHFIFSLHFHTFIFIFLILSLFFDEFLFDFSFLISILLILSYLFLAMKKFYGENLKNTIYRFSLLSISYLVLFIPLFFLLVFFTALVFY